MKTLFITLLILFVLSSNSIGQSSSFKYTFEVDTLTEFTNKSFLSDFTKEIQIQSRNIIGAKSFEFISPESFSEDDFALMATSLGPELISFNKSKIFLEYQNIEKNGGQDCPDAAMVCNNTSFSGNASGYGNQELNGSNDGCLSGEHQSSWYYINVGADGTLEMEIEPDANDDYDWAIWGPFDENSANANCPPSTQPIRCSYAGTSNSTGMGDYWGCISWHWFWGYCTGNGWISPPENSEGSGGDGWVAPLNVQEDEVYIMVVDNWSVSGDPFDLTWGGTAGLDCTPVNLPVELLDFSGKNHKNYNLLEWTTSSEKNNDYFQIEHSVDGKNWKTIGEIKGAGNTSSEQYYSSTHVEYPTGINYYRLTQIDYDGTINKHQIISIDNSKNRELLKRVNMMGQEVDENFKGIVILYYSDGITKKVLQ